MSTTEVTCPECGGDGHLDEEGEQTCPTCHGDGLVEDWTAPTTGPATS